MLTLSPGDTLQVGQHQTDSPQASVPPQKSIAFCGAHALTGAPQLDVGHRVKTKFIFEERYSMPFNFPNQPTDMHGLAFYCDGTTGDFAAMPLTPHDADVAAEVKSLEVSARTFSSSIGKVGAEAVALSVKYQQPGRACMFAQALHQLTGDRFFIIHLRRGSEPCDATFVSLPLQSLEQAHDWLALLGAGFTKAPSAPSRNTGRN